MDNQVQRTEYKHLIPWTIKYKEPDISISLHGKSSTKNRIKALHSMDDQVQRTGYKHFTPWKIKYKELDKSIALHGQLSTRNRL